MRASILFVIALCALAYGRTAPASKHETIEATQPPATPSPATWFFSFKTNVNVSNPVIVLNITRSFSPNGV